MSRQGWHLVDQPIAETYSSADSHPQLHDSSMFIRDIQLILLQVFVQVGQMAGVEEVVKGTWSTFECIIAFTTVLARLLSLSAKCDKWPWTVIDSTPRLILQTQVRTPWGQTLKPSICFEQQLCPFCFPLTPAPSLKFLVVEPWLKWHLHCLLLKPFHPPSDFERYASKPFFGLCFQHLSFFLNPAPDKVCHQTWVKANSTAPPAEEPGWLWTDECRQRAECGPI